MFMLGYAVNTNIRDVRTVVYDQAQSQESRSLLREFTNSGDFLIIEEVFTEFGPKGFKVEYTEGRECFGHGFWSLHHSGNAVDVRTKTLPDKGVGQESLSICKSIQGKLDRTFGKGSYRDLWNDRGKSQPHLHVQYSRGTRQSAPVDAPGVGNTRLA
jgi:hypothetical protein